MPDPQKICSVHFLNAEGWLKVYIGWRISEGVASIKYQWMSGKKMMLLYNVKSGLGFVFENGGCSK